MNISNNKKWINENWQDESLLMLDGMDDAIVGVVSGIDIQPKVVYDREKIIEILMTHDMTYEEAVEFMDFNITGAYMGESTPVFLDKVK